MLYETFKEQDTFVCLTHVARPYRGYTIASSSTLIRYAAYRKSSILFKALAKLMLPYSTKF